jgi:hypothetical protein
VAAKAPEQAKGEEIPYRVEGTEVLCTSDAKLFPLLCEMNSLALLAAPIASYEAIVRQLLAHFQASASPFSTVARACTDMDLFCEHCGHQYDPSELIELAGASKIFHDARFGPTQSCPRCSSKQALYFFDNWQPGHIDLTDVAALEAFTKFKTKEFFDYRSKNGKTCQLCGSPVTRLSAFLVVSSHGVGKLECAKCYGTLPAGENLLRELRKDPNCVGRGVLRNARNYVQGKYDRKLVRLG